MDDNFPPENAEWSFREGGVDESGWWGSGVQSPRLLSLRRRVLTVRGPTPERDVRQGLRLRGPMNTASEASAATRLVRIRGTQRGKISFRGHQTFFSSGRKSRPISAETQEQE